MTLNKNNKKSGNYPDFFIIRKPIADIKKPICRILMYIFY